jgi:hypothetical protein
MAMPLSGAEEFVQELPSSWSSYGRVVTLASQERDELRSGLEEATAPAERDPTPWQSGCDQERIPNEPPGAVACSLASLWGLSDASTTSSMNV